MSAPPIRPRFHLRSSNPPDELMERLRQRLPKNSRCVAESVGRHAEIFLPPEERRIWSPYLSVTAERGPEGGTLLKGRFAPHPHLWTLYMFLAFGLGFALLVGLSWGYAQWSMDVTPWAWVSFPVIVILGLMLYLASQVGQKLGANQMVDLRSGLEELVVEGDQTSQNGDQIGIIGDPAEFDF